MAPAVRSPGIHGSGEKLKTMVWNGTKKLAVDSELLKQVGGRRALAWDYLGRASASRQGLPRGKPRRRRRGVGVRIRRGQMAPRRSWSVA